MKYVIVDLETRDFDLRKGAIYQVGLVLTDESFNVIESKEISIIEDETQIDKGYGFGYQNISNNIDCKDEFKDFVSKYEATLIAHNSGFEKKFLKHYDWIDEDAIILDSITMIKKKVKGLDSYSLDNLIKEFKLSIDNRHTALDDALVTAEILNIVEAEIYKPRPRKQSNSTPKELVDNMEEIKANGTNEIVSKIDINDIICFTGKGAYDRSYLTELATKNGNTVAKSMTKAVTLLVVGDLTIKSSKIVKAEERGVKVISSDDFVKYFE